jgi:membrane associated rhomboid family serine protease
MKARECIEYIRQLQTIYLDAPTVGASGAIYGVLLAFGMTFPNMLIYLYFFIPIKAKWAVIGFGAMELFYGLWNNPSDNVAHFAHLGGMLFGVILILYWRKRPFSR